MNELPDCPLGAEGGTRTPTPIRAQRPERCVSTNFTTSAGLSIWTGLCYCIYCDLSIARFGRDCSESGKTGKIARREKHRRFPHAFTDLVTQSEPRGDHGSHPMCLC